jgi:hypothetical protein
MKRNFAFLVVGLGLVLALLLQAAPTPTPAPPPIKVPRKKVTPAPQPSPIQIPGKNPTPKPQSSPIHVPGKNAPAPTVAPIKTPGKVNPAPTPTPAPIHIPGKHGPTPTPTIAPIKIPGKNGPTPTPTIAPIKIPGKNGPTPTPTIAPIKIPGKNGPTPTPTTAPIKIPGKNTGTPTPTPKILIPGKKIVPPPAPPAKNDNKKDGHVWINIDVVPPSPSELGPPIHIGNIPGYESVPHSQINRVAGGMAPIPDSYAPPPENAPVQVSPTALRAWNGQAEPPARAFDQTRVKLASAADGSLSWQFYWKTTGPKAEAARWEVATVPFVGGLTTFPPAGLIGYGDASINAEAPLSENFFALDFNSFAKSSSEGPVPKKYYMRVVGVDLEGNTVGTPSNFVRIDLP